jgi:RNA polymerase sigma-70 factor (ECF subfamily)
LTDTTILKNAAVLRRKIRVSAHRSADYNAADSPRDEAVSHSPDSSGNGSQASTGTSRSLLERVRADESSAWDRLVDLYAPLVLHWCRRSALQDEDAADVFQEVFLAVATHLKAFRKDRPNDTFRGWLRVITQHKILDLHRRRKHEPGGVGGSQAQHRLADLPAPVAREEPTPTDQQVERSLFFRGLETLRGEFAPKTWQAFWKTAVDGREAKDVADELGMSPGAVRVSKSRVLHRLRQELGDLME